MLNAACVEESKCNGCKLCIYSCPDPNVIMLKDKKAYVVSERCKACGLCATVCPKGAIILKEAI